VKELVDEQKSRLLGCRNGNDLDEETFGHEEDI
jgi:hypothetical protein